jgi:hypothetical protein
MVWIQGREVRTLCGPEWSGRTFRRQNGALWQVPPAQSLGVWDITEPRRSFAVFVIIMISPEFSGTWKCYEASSRARVLLRTQIHLLRVPFALGGCSLVGSCFSVCFDRALRLLGLGHLHPNDETPGSCSTSSASCVAETMGVIGFSGIVVQ